MVEDKRTTEKRTTDRGRSDKLKGKAKEVAGGITGNDGLRRRGKAEQVRGKVKEKGNQAVDRAREAFDDED